MEITFSTQFDFPHLTQKVKNARFYAANLHFQSDFLL